MFDLIDRASVIFLFLVTSHPEAAGNEPKLRGWCPCFVDDAVVIRRSSAGNEPQLFEDLFAVLSDFRWTPCRPFLHRRT